ncbi:type I-E CRISPR-associated protein Cas5/CasD [Anaerococcus murdochii]|uniref:type I-E CRISPR-associated protein Cas5/CasD n=1 Tax=Anaerococcus murdochii TaxID=411577 RepID=UPI0032B4767D
MKTILLKLTGPMQSWGTSSRFETRMSDYYPSKSGVIGIIAASLGYNRDEDEKIQKLNDLDFAVRVDQEGVLKKDFHIAIKLDDNGNAEKPYVTNRYYMEDAVFVVAISHEDDKWIEEILQGLKYPYFQPFMGRRCCPLPGSFILGKSEEDPIEALKNLDWQAAAWYKKKNKNYRADIYADKDLLPENPHTIRNDRVVSFSQKERKFGPRFEARSSILMAKSDKDPLDFFESLEG